MQFSYLSQCCNALVLKMSLGLRDKRERLGQLTTGLSLDRSSSVWLTSEWNSYEHKASSSVTADSLSNPIMLTLEKPVSSSKTIVFDPAEPSESLSETVQISSTPCPLGVANGGRTPLKGLPRFLCMLWATDISWLSRTNLSWDIGWWNFRLQLCSSLDDGHEVFDS